MSLLLSTFNIEMYKHTNTQVEITFSIPQSTRLHIKYVHMYVHIFYNFFFLFSVVDCLMHSHAAFGGIGHTVVANIEKRNENEINKTHTALNESIHTANCVEQNTSTEIAP